MSLRNGCLLIVSCLALAAGVGCSAPTPPSYGNTAKVSTGIVFHAKASSATQKSLGVTRWHAIIEKTSGAVVLDGSDSKGKVRFVTAMRMDEKKKQLIFDTYAPTKGSVVIDMKTGRVVSSTMAHKEWAGFVGALTRDWDAHQKVTPYGALGYVIAGAAIIGGAIAIAGAIAVAPVAAGAVIVTVGTYELAGGLIAIGGGVLAAVKEYNDDKQNDARDAKIDALAKDVADMKAAQQKDPATDPAKVEAPAAEPAKDPAADPAAPPADPSKDPAADPAADPAQPPADAPATDTPATPATDTPATPATDTPATPEPPATQDLPADNKGGDLETGGGLDNGGTTTGGDTTGGSADTTGGSADTTGGSADTTGGGADTSGGGADTTGGGDTGGGEFAIGMCRRVAISKLTKVRACTRY